MANEKLLQITDNGPVKVLGRGTNSYVSAWSRAGYIWIQTYWDRWDEFPTAVQVGDLIWVLQDNVVTSGGEFSGYAVSRWTLAGITVNKGGKNVAYPAVTNNTDVGGTSSYHIGSGYSDVGLHSATLANPTAYLNVTTPAVAGNSRYYTARMKTHVGYDITKVYPQFTGSDVTHYFYDANGSSTYPPFIHGLGYRGETVGSAVSVAMMFPPIRYKWQFEELYGKESDWVTSTLGIWEDTYPNGTTDVYPFEFEEPSESLFRDVPGDTTGDGVDDSAIEVAALAAGAVTLPSLDVSACKLDINTKALDDTFSSLKDSLLGAVDASGLSALASKATELKNSLLSNLPELPEFPDFASQFASLDFNNPIDVEAFKEKWGKIVSNIDSMIDKVKFDPANLNICAVSDIKAEVQDDGSYAEVVVPPPVVIPREKPKEVKKTIVKVKESIEEPQSTFETAFGVDPKMAAAGSKSYLSSWKELSNDSQVISNFDYALIEAAVERRIELRRDGEYTEFKRRVSEKKPLGDLKRFIDEEDTICRALDFAKTYHRVLAEAQRIVSNHVIQYAGYFYSVSTLPDYTDLVSKALTADRFPRPGQLFLQYDAVHASYTQSDLDKDLAFVFLINNKVKEYIWKRDIIQNYAIKGIVYPKENTNLTKEVPSIYVS